MIQEMQSEELSKFVNTRGSEKKKNYSTNIIQSSLVILGNTDVELIYIILLKQLAPFVRFVLCTQLEITILIMVEKSCYYRYFSACVKCIKFKNAICL